MNTLSGSVLAKVREQAGRLAHLLELVPENALDFRPAAGFSLGELLGHLLECLAGFCAVLHTAYPEELAHFLRLRSWRVNHRCEAAEALARVREYMACIEEGFGLLKDDDLGKSLPTVFVPEGETLLTLLLGNLEHLINHKHQLFCYLKLLGVPVGTPDLYQFRASRNFKVTPGL